MDLATVVEVLHATQAKEGEARRKAEEMLDSASTMQPNQLVAALAGAMSASQVDEACRAEAAIILRQLVVGLASRDPVWDNLEAQTKKDLMTHLLKSISEDKSSKVRRQAGHVVAAIANEIADTFDELNQAWPDVLPAIAAFTGTDKEVSLRVAALGMLKDMTGTIGEGLLQQPSTIQMLMSQLSDQAHEVRAAGAQLVLSMVAILATEDLEILRQSKQVASAVVTVIQNLANNMHEVELKETLEILSSGAEEEPEFFKDCGCLKDLTETLLKICAVGSQAFADDDIRQAAMEAVMTLTIGLSEDVAQPEGLPLLEHLITLNLQWMLEVEQDVEAWTKEGKEEDDDDCDDDVVGQAEENLDRLAESFCEDEEEETFMTTLFKAIRAFLALPDADWRHIRSAVMAVAQVVEYLEEEAWVHQSVDFMISHITHAHPRVRYAAFWSIGQACYDQSPDVQESFAEQLLPKFVDGLDDANIRVATAAASAFTSMGEELDGEELDPHMDALLPRFINRLHSDESRAMRENCLSGIAVIAEGSKEQFKPYYPDIMPMLKQVVSKSTKPEERSLQGKAFECIALVGYQVGKETFQADGFEVMTVMLRMLKEGFESDDPRRASFMEASAKIASALGKDFKPFAQEVLNYVFKVLTQKPAEKPGSGDDDDEEDENLDLYGVRTQVLEEMEEALELTDTLVKGMEDEFVEFLPLTVKNLLVFLPSPMSEDLRTKNFETWECLVTLARAAAESGRLGGNVLQEMVTEFLKNGVNVMVTTANDPKNKRDKEGFFPEALCTTLQSWAKGIANVVNEAGTGVLSKEGVKDLAEIIVKMIDALQMPTPANAKEEASATAQKASAEPGPRRRRGGPVIEEDSDGDEKEDDEDEIMPVTEQSVRFALVDMLGALMRCSKDAFVELALPTMMELVKLLVRPERSAADRSLGFYLADDMVACLGEKTVPFWNGFMNEALVGMMDTVPIVRQFCASTIGNGACASKEAFAQVVPAACATIHKVLQKFGERHRRRRAVKTETKLNALAIDACIRALGQLCQMHEVAMGADAGTAWGMWLSNLPIKYNADAGKAAHAQLLDLIVANHAYFTSPQQLPKVMEVLAELFKSKFSNDELNRRIAGVVASLPEEALKALTATMQDKQQKKVMQMLKMANS